jgi:hypothetical protein
MEQGAFPLVLFAATSRLQSGIRPPAPLRIAGKRGGGVKHRLVDVPRIAEPHAVAGFLADFEKPRFCILDTPMPLKCEVTPPIALFAAVRAGTVSTPQGARPAISHSGAIAGRFR